MKSTVLPSHTNTPQWQSFEVRMRRRRTERCVARATEALRARRLADAREALHEAQLLEPDSPDVRQLAMQITTAAERIRPGSGGRSRRLGAAALVVCAAGAGWLYLVSSPVAVGPQPLPTPVAVRTPETAAPGRPPAAASIAEPAETTSPAIPSGEIDDQTERAGDSSPAPEPPPSIEERPVAVAEASRLAALRSRPEPPARDARAATAAAPPPAAIAGTSGNSAPRTATASPPFRGPAPTSASVPESVATPPRSLATASTPPPPSPEPPAPAAALVRDTLPPPPIVVSETAVILASEPAPSAPEVARSETPPAAVDTVSNERQVRAALTRYEAAYSQLDAAAAGAVFPSVDQRGLADAFRNLTSQRILLGQCDVRVSGGSATADCSGQARWTTKVGGGTQTAARRWQFELRSAGGEWVIADARVR